MPATVEERPSPTPEYPTFERIDSATRPGRRPMDLLRTARSVRSYDAATLVRLAIVAAAVVGAIWAVDRYGRHYTFLDMNVYHGAMVYWTHGGDLYSFIAPGTTLGFTYPPFAALVMTPIAVLPTVAAGWVNLIASVAALAIILAWLLIPIADRHGVPRWFAVALATPLAAATEPMRETLGFGQVNILLALLVYADFMALRNRARISAARLAADAGNTRTGRPGTASQDFAGRSTRAGDPGPVPAGETVRRMWNAGTWAGVGVGLATAIKLTPGLFIVYFVVTRQWRAAITSAATAVGTTLLAFAVTGGNTAAYFTTVLPDTGRVGEVDATANQSLAGVLARLYDSPTTPTLMWLAFAALLLAVGLIRAGNAHNEGDELAAFTLVGLTANVICPISWTHHLVFVIPALIVLGDAAARRRRAVRGLAARGPWTWGPAGVPALAGLRQAAAAVGVFWLFVVSPIWRYEHKLPDVSHYQDGLHGALAENSLALALIALVVLLPWRPGADPAFCTGPIRKGPRR